MSRVGRQPVVVPAGVKANVAGSKVVVEGPRGKLEYNLSHGVKAELKDGALLVKLVSESGKELDSKIASKESKALYGTTRAHLNNLVVGVTKGFKKTLEMTGVGFAAKVVGSTIDLSVGFSHQVILDIPKTVKCVVNKTTIELESNECATLGLFASKIHDVQPSEPYLGKGIKYTGEVIRRKAGKAGKK